MSRNLVTLVQDVLNLDLYEESVYLSLRFLPFAIYFELKRCFFNEFCLFAPVAMEEQRLKLT